MAREKKDVLAERRDLMAQASDTGSEDIVDILAAITVELCRTIDDAADKIASAIVVASCKTEE
jgi:hypothetical protein